MKIKNFVLGVGILVVYALLLFQGIQTFYPSPEWGDYCDMERYPKFITPNIENTNCNYSQELNDKELACNNANGLFRYKYDSNGCVIEGNCDPCQSEYNDAMDVYSRNVFIISLIIAVITFIIGFSILSIEPVGSALLASGVWAVLFGTIYNWRNFGNAWKFILLLVVLVILIWIALRLNRKKKRFLKIFRR